MDDQKNIKTSAGKQLDLPCIIIDKSGRIIALNGDVKKIIPSALPQLNFFDLFDENNLLTLQRVFIDARKYDTAVKDILEVKSGSDSKQYEVTFSPLKSENNIYFIVCFSLLTGSKTDQETKKFIIATAEIERYTSDKRILSTINKIKLTYPFTFIEKAKLQKEINEIENFFWVKDPSGKFILINESYAKALGFSSAQLENKNEIDFLPKYLIPLYRTVDQYIGDTSNALILDSSSSPISPDLRKEIQIIQFPICDLENKTVAIIGFSQPVAEKNFKDPECIDRNFIKNLPLALLFIDNENKIASYSTELMQLLLIPERQEFVKSSLNRLFDKSFTKTIEDYTSDISRTDELDFNYTFEEKGKLTVEVNVQKIFDSNNIYIGAKILLNQKNEIQILNENKAQLYDSLIHNIPEAMFIYDLDNLKFLEVNDAALKLYGYKKSEFLNMDLTDLYAPEDIQTLIQSSDTKTVNSGPWRHKRSDGSSILVELTRTSVEYKGKKGHLNIIKNVSERIEEKKKIQLLQSVFDHTADLIINTDKDGFIYSVNEQVSKKLGYSKKDLESRPFISLVSDDDRAKVNKNIFHSGLLKTISLELEFKKPSGTLLKAIVIATPIKDYNGEIENYSILIKPVEDKQENGDIQKLENEAADKIDAPFLSHMFHELLTPINVILGFAQELWESIDKPSEEQKEAVEIIKENQKLLLQIMDNAVEYSTLQQKIVKFKPELIKFVDLLNPLKENTKKLSESKKVELEYGKISSSLTLESDKQKFISLVSLLIKIGIQITKETSIYLSAFNSDENNIVVSIKDTKKAITPYLLKGFNDVFSDEESVIRRNYGFSRFSLRLANKLIELLSANKYIVMKGDEAVEFGFSFPVKFNISEKSNIEVESVKAVETDRKSAGKTPLQDIPDKPAATAKFTELDLSQLNVLYFEDQVDSQILFKNQMKDLRSIEFAPSFESALPLLKTKRFDVIIMDINLQGEYNGLDALRIIQKMPGHRDIPIIASTAYTQPGARENFMAAGFTEFLAKPLLREKVIDLLRKLLVK
ncbi:MAG TPA: PAS domain S-box protein [Melioribacteraceae bacterium]|nr:PAS domain S-box protein [Melioribacteraceae bacterium]